MGFDHADKRNFMRMKEFLLLQNVFVKDCFNAHFISTKKLVYETILQFVYASGKE